MGQDRAEDSFLRGRGFGYLSNRARSVGQQHEITAVGCWYSETSPESHGKLDSSNSIDAGTEKGLTSVNRIEDVNDS